MKKALLHGMAAVALVCSVSSASGAPIYCQGRVTDVLVYADGTVMILGDWRGDWTTLCGLNTVWGGVPVGVCKAWFTNAQVAVTAGRAVVVHYPDSPSACNAIGTYGNAPVPGYFMLRSQ